MPELSASAEPKPRKRLSGWWYVAVALALLGLAVLRPIQQHFAIKFLRYEGALLQSHPHTVLGFAVPLVEAPTHCILPGAGGHSVKTGSETDPRTAEAAWWVEHEPLRRELMSAVSKLPTLTSLSMGWMPVSGDDLQKLPNLKFLSLHSSNVTDATLVHIIGLDQITELDLSDTAITDAGIHELRQMSQLQLLVLDDTDLTDKGVLELQHFPNLRYVSIKHTRFVRAKAFDELRAAAPKLEVVDED